MGGWSTRPREVGDAILIILGNLGTGTKACCSSNYAVGQGNRLSAAGGGPILT